VWLKQNRPAAIIFAAAKVGGIYANDTFPADFVYDNLAIGTHVIHSAHVAGVDRLVFLGSSCIYPTFAPQTHQGRGSAGSRRFRWRAGSSTPIAGFLTTKST
jgi:nucleoside-diphosphate-sugar epimerase